MNEETEAQEGELGDWPELGRRSLAQTRSPDSHSRACAPTKPNGTISGWWLSPTSTKAQKAREPSLCTSWYDRALNHLGEGDRQHRTNSEGLGVELAQPGLSWIASLDSVLVDLVQMRLDMAHGMN